MLATLAAGSGENHDQDFLQYHPNRMLPVRGRAEGVTEEERGELTFDWSTLVPRLVHPAKVAIIEALLWVGEPLSPSDLVRAFASQREYYLAIVAYHVRELAELGAIEVVRTRQKRGAQEKFYFFPRK
jgi:hypothetical protein